MSAWRLGAFGVVCAGMVLAAGCAQGDAPAAEAVASEEAAAPLAPQAGPDLTDQAFTEATETDRAFAEYARRHGVREAFARYMHPVDGQLIRPGAVYTGREAILRSFEGWPADAELVWTPDSGEAAASGEFAVTSGRYQYIVGGKLMDEGRYLTIWKKNDQGDWRGMVDLGVPDPPRAAVAADPA